jgi:cytochrome c553
MNMRFFPAAARQWLLACALGALAPIALTGAYEEVPVALLGTCVACHGADGIGKAPQYPNLQGQKAPYLEKQLKAFRSGERKDPNMSAMAAPLSDEDIAKLAAYFENVN